MSHSRHNECQLSKNRPWRLTFSVRANTPNCRVVKHNADSDSVITSIVSHAGRVLRQRIALLVIRAGERFNLAGFLVNERVAPCEIYA